jgi:electron transfer flavoprotein alpha subunit
MNRVLVVAEHRDGKLNPAVAKCVSCAAAIPEADISVAVLAADGAAVAAAASAIQGVARVLLVKNPANEPALAAVLAPQVAALAAGHSHVLGPSTTFGKDLMPRVAGLLGAPQMSDVMAVESATRFRRPVYAGNAIATVRWRRPPVVATVRPVPDGARRTARAHRDAGARVVLEGSRCPRRERHLTCRPRAVWRRASQRRTRADPGLRTARAAMARARGGDAGYAPNELQVGQTGKIIAPELYIAIGISGAIQHLTGIKDARTIVAINKDAEAPIFEIADYGLVGDLFSLIPEIEKNL